MGDAITWFVFIAVALTVIGYAILVVLGLYYAIRHALGR